MGGSTGTSPKEGGVPPPKVPPAPLGMGRGIKRATDDEKREKPVTECHNLAAGEEPIFYTDQREEGSGDAEHVNVDPYTEHHGDQEVGGGILPQTSGAASSPCPPRNDGTASELSYSAQRRSVAQKKTVGPYHKNSAEKGRGVYPAGLPRGRNWADQTEEEDEEDSGEGENTQGQGTDLTDPGAWRVTHEQVRQKWYEHQPQEAAAATGAPVYAPARSTEEFMQNLTGMMSTISKKIGQMDQDRARDHQLLDASHTKILEHIEKRLEERMADVRRYVSAQETKRILKKRGAKSSATSRADPTEDSDSSSTFSSAAEDDRKSGKGRVTKRRTSLSDGEDRTMSQGAPSTPR